MSVATLTEMSQQTVEIKFEGERLGSYTDKNNTYALAPLRTYTLFSVPGGLYVVHVEEDDESWLETNGQQGFSAGMVGTFFPNLAEACGVEQVLPHDKSR